MIREASSRTPIRVGHVHTPPDVLKIENHRCRNKTPYNMTCQYFGTLQTKENRRRPGGPAATFYFSRQFVRYCGLVRPTRSLPPKLVSVAVFHHACFCSFRAAQSVSGLHSAISSKTTSGFHARSSLAKPCPIPCRSDSLANRRMTYIC